jgi:type III restriction enzyme
VRIDTERLIADALPEVNAIHVRPPRLAVTKARVDVATDDRLQAVQMTATRTVASLEARAPLPNLLALIENLMEHTTPPVRVSRRTLLEMLRRSMTLREAMKNPQEYATQMARILKEKLADQLAAGIQYVPIDEWYDLSQLQDEIISTKELVPAEKSVYDQVVCDSGPERAFVDGLERHDAVKLYIKLPGWFTVPTPIGEYNPDWAIVMQDRDAHGRPTGETLYLVRETKDTLNLDELRKDEKRKILCGARHFARALGTDYQVVTKARELPKDGYCPPLR